MNKMEETAIDWLLEKLTETHTNDEWKEIIRQAKAMELEQMTEAWKVGYDLAINGGRIPKL